jgi:hypothetical protein
LHFISMSIIHLIYAFVLLETWACNMLMGSCFIIVCLWNVVGVTCRCNMGCWHFETCQTCWCNLASLIVVTKSWNIWNRVLKQMNELLALLVSTYATLGHLCGHCVEWLTRS